MGIDRSSAHAAAAIAVTVKRDEVLGVEGAETGRQEDAGQAGHEARDDPCHGHDAVGVDPVELDQPPALDRAAHLQAEAV